MDKLILEAGGTPMVGYETLSIGGSSPVLYDQKARPRPFLVKDTNNTSDIEGTFSVNKYDRWSVRDTMTVVPRREGTSGTSKSRNVPDMQLRIDDIEGTRYAPRSGMQRSRRQVEPLSPNYALPSFALPLPQIDLRPMRHVLKTFDIEGAQPQTQKTFYKTSDVLAVGDVSGGALNQRQTGRWRRQQLQEQQEKDDDGKEIRFQDRTTRRTNALEPQYKYNGLIIEDDAVRTKPRKPKRFIPSGTFSLVSQDIPGATPGSLKRPITEIRNIMSTSDVEGAHADSAKKMQSLRCTCPLSPTYNGLDNTPLPPVLSPLINPLQLSMVPTLRFLKERGSSLQALSSPISLHPSSF